MLKIETLCSKCRKAHPCKKVRGYPPGRILELRTSECASVGYVHLSYSCKHKLTVSALRRVLQLTNDVIRTARLAQRVTAAGQLASCCYLYYI